MKKLIVLLLTLSAFGCENEKAEPNLNSFKAKLNGSDWIIAGIGLDNNTKFGMVCGKGKKIDGVEVPWQSLSFSVVRKSIGFQRLYKETQLLNTNPDSANTCASFSTTQDDGDVLCDIYEVIEADSLTNYIQITKETGNYKEVWGTFSVNFVRTRGCSESTLPDTLRIRDGQFHVVLQK